MLYRYFIIVYLFTFVNGFTILKKEKELINYVSVGLYKRMKSYTSYQDLKQNVYFSYYQKNITFPIYSNSTLIKNIFSETSKQINRKVVVDFVDQPYYDNIMFSSTSIIDKLDPNERQFILDYCNKIDVMNKYKLTFPRVKKEIKRIKKYVLNTSYYCTSTISIFPISTNTT